MGYTKGPWKARNQKSTKGDDIGWIIEVDEGRGGRIGWSSRAFADTNKEEDRGGPEAKGNAFLMAAAPDLLEALKRCVIELEAFCAGHSDAEINIAKSAIAKADPS